MGPYNQFVPAGSYYETSTNIVVTINALAEMPNGTWNSSVPKAYPAEWAPVIQDIANIYGTLELSFTPPANQNQKNGPYVPAGSYQDTCQAIWITIHAQCQMIDGKFVPSTLVYPVAIAGSIKDICNDNGVLTILY